MRTALVVVTFLLAGAISLNTMAIHRLVQKAPVEARAPEYIADQPPGTTLLLVAITPDGTRVYRIDNEKSMIVPALVAVSPSGQMAFSR